MTVDRVRHFSRVVGDLSATQKPFALVGALAVAVRAVERTTKDIDFAVVVDAENEALALLASLETIGYQVQFRTRDARTAELRGATLTIASDAEQTVVVDLLFDTCGIEREIVRSAEQVEVLPGLVIPVATRGHLIAMKTLSLDDARRRQDRLHLADLLESASRADISEAREALWLMQERGFGFAAAKDDLLGELEEHCRLYSPALLEASELDDPDLDL